MTSSLRTALVLVLLTACADPGADGPRGPAGNDGQDGQDIPDADATVASLFPASALLGRSAEVIVSLSEPAEVTAVELGDGVAVEQLEVLTPTEIRVALAIDPGAEVGPRDLLLETSAGTLEAGKALFIEAPMEVTTAGFIVQGGLFWMDVTNVDAQPFDPSTFAVSAGAAVDTVLVDGITSSQGRMLALAAPNAPPGPTQLVGENRYDGEVVTSFHSVAGLLDIAARAPTVVTSELTAQPLMLAGETRSYVYAALPLLGFVDVKLAPSSGATGEPVAWLFGHSGSFDHDLGVHVGTTPVPMDATNPSDLYAVVADNQLGGSATHAFDIAFEPVAATLLAEQSGAHDAYPGQLLGCVAAGALTPCLVQGTLGAEGELDVYRIEGLSQAAALTVTLESDVHVAVWAQSGAITYLNPGLNAVFDGATGIEPQTQSRRLAVGHGVAPYVSWTIIVAGAPGNYRLGLRVL